MHSRIILMAHRHMFWMHQWPAKDLYQGGGMSIWTFSDMLPPNTMHGQPCGWRNGLEEEIQYCLINSKLVKHNF